MTTTPAQFAALAFSALMTVATVAGVNGLAKSQYAAADALVMAPYGQTHVALQTVTVVGHRADT
jgi:hypothetical protein